MSDLKIKPDLVGELYELDLTDPYTRMFSLAERWAQRARKAEAKLKRIEALRPDWLASANAVMDAPHTGLRGEAAINFAIATRLRGCVAELDAAISEVES